MSAKQKFMNGKYFKLPLGNGLAFRRMPSPHPTLPDSIFMRHAYWEDVFYCSLTGVSDNSFHVSFLLLGKMLIVQEFKFSQLVFEEGGEGV